LNLQNKCNETPLSVAKSKGFYEIEKLISDKLKK